MVTGVDDRGRQLGVNAWPDVCGSACIDTTRLFQKGCDEGIHSQDDPNSDPEKECLVLCSYCYSSWHPKCAGLCPTIKRVQDDWCCPECVWVAEESLQLNPLHMDPAHVTI